MVEIIFFILFICFVGLLAVAKTMHVPHSTLSDYELNRQASSGDQLAMQELQRRELLPVFVAVWRLIELFLLVVVVAVLFMWLPVWLAALAALVALVAVEVASLLGWLAAPAQVLQRKVEPAIAKHLSQYRTFLHRFAPKKHAQAPAFMSREELRQLIKADQHILEPHVKSHLLGAFDFANTTLSDHMVERKNIITVDQAETVGPLLLDRLHKTGHNIFVVVKKNLEHAQGLLYMSDLVPLDPEVKTVEDVTRTRVHYLPESATLKDVLTASLKTGRQFFLVANNAGRITGLITLRDALRQLLGQELPTESAVATDPANL
ncbi:MAG TPA: CBS domain-containing protein [Candidatus Saccharimonadales bacterium]|nr:CBS domain-containing protein [Candidatus Saccharimonadales bacterium]